MKRKLQLAISVAMAGGLPSALAVGGGLIEDSTATLQLRNYYFMRDFSDIQGRNQQSKAEEWAQGFILNFKSGYTPGPVGFGLDVLGLMGVKLDSNSDRTNTGLLPVHNDGKAADNYGRLGLTLKARFSGTELRYGEQTPNLPILAHTDNRLLPQTYRGTTLISREIPGLTLQAGRLNTAVMRNSTDHQKMTALIINDPINPRRLAYATGDHYNYIGGDYSFNANRTTLSFWQGQLEDIYQQRFYGIKHALPLGAWTLSSDIGYFTATEDGHSKVGNLDNQLAYGLFSAKYKGHTFHVGYQGVYGDDGFLRIGDTLSPLGNELPTYQFSAPDERSWQIRYDFDFAGVGLPGLTSTVRYVKGDNVDTGARGFEGEDWERDLDLAYTIQSGPLKNVSIRWRNATARSNYATDIDENRLIVNYPIKLF
ncbi:OprD family porin [Azotobacter beijerinckii]|uniref:Outer membrane porin, OprD family n=3 Tax=Azotobacter beijerinckii TaxID=170623 RepID=A0A1I4ALY3_9GAMM|nr:OprD family porin [Azotobacter beijerinckii]SFA99989.1 outer membrane porin, OprD family [Azotobacter beijerinckii]SFK57283.1 outer membrane porin, OprD family [Azotobacter beijerinckii]